MVGERLSFSCHLRQGSLGRGAPCDGEDNEYVYGELLGMSSQEIKALAEEDAI
jgi:crotonobetainyl-CoA:carnitine CoA-transferase CaiB-like acyl-CoA transferase